MDRVEFVKSLDKDKVYLFGFDNTKWDMPQIEEFFKIVRESGLQGIGVFSDGFQILEPIGVDKEKLKELIK